MKPSRLLRRLAVGALHNVAFRDLMSLAEAFGFRLDRISGSHHILRHRSVPALLNLQNIKGKAKPYQVRQLLSLIEDYNLAMADEEDET